MEKEFKQAIKVDCPYCREYNGVVMCMDYVIPCEQNVARGKCKVTEVYTKIIEDSLAGYLDDLALYGRVTNGHENVSQTAPADVVPVVRCNDCKFYTSMRPDIKTGICDLNVHHMGDNGFCSCGERKE